MTSTGNIGGDDALAWVAIGAAASLAGMIWPFRRGGVGVVANLFVGAGGAVLAALLSCLILPWSSYGHTPARLFFAAFGAIAALGIVHLAYERYVRYVARRRLKRA
jgi:uncharacterized membrane protein YeaQ/YmgE (transglycosylase-associated protein family)